MTTDKGYRETIDLFQEDDKRYALVVLSPPVDFTDVTSQLRNERTHDEMVFVEIDS